MAENINKTAIELQMMMADIAHVLSSHNANIEDLLVCAERLLVSAFGQLADEKCDGLELFASGVCAKIESIILLRIRQKPMEMN